MSYASVQHTEVPQRLESTILELLALQESLSSGEISPQLLSEFRDALNRVRNTAWAVQQFMAAGMFDQGHDGLKTFLAAERIRVAYQVCHALQKDLHSEDEFQKGQLLELYGVISDLKETLKNRL